MEPPWVTEARRQLVLAQASPTPEAGLATSLTSIETLLRRGAPADGESLATLAVHSQGGALSKAEAAQVVRLSNVAHRASGGGVVDPLDAAQAAQLAQALLARQVSGYAPPPPPPMPPPVAPGPLAESPLPTIQYAPPVADTVRRQGFPVGAILLVLVGTLLLVLILVLGPLVLALVGPPWVRWLAAPAAVVAGLVTLWQLFRVTVRGGVIPAVLIAVSAGLLVGVLWGWGAQQGLMPPLRYFAPFLAPTVSARPVADDEPSLHVGGHAVVANTGESGLRVRARPGLSMPEVGRLPDGSVVTIVGASQMADGLEWWRVQSAGVSGWVAAIYLTPVD
ncbi:MAG: SH3 domain-containing protein [Anaerolineae bacterium]